MAWTESEALSFMNSGKSFDEFESSKTSQSVEDDKTSTGGNVEPPATETDKVETSKDVKPTEPKEEKSTSSDEPENPEKVSKDEVENKGKSSKKYTPEQKQRHAFQKMKSKLKDKDEIIAAKESELEKLKAEVEKYKALTKKDFGDNEELFTDYKIDQRFKEEKVNRLQKEIEDERLAADREEQAQIAQYRLETCFPDEGDRDKYQQLVYNAETNFAAMHPEIGYQRFSQFLESEKDRTVIGYIQDSDNAPKLIRHFIYKPEVALRIMQMRNPINKVVELKQLENRMLQFERAQAAKAQEVAAQPAVQEKKELPNTGKVVSNNTNEQTSVWDKKEWSERDALNYLASKQRGY